MTVSDKIVEGYLADIKKIKDSNTATELTYRPRFKEFIEVLCNGRYYHEFKCDGVEMVINEIKHMLFDRRRET